MNIREASRLIVQIEELIKALDAVGIDGSKLTYRIIRAIEHKYAGD